MCNDECRSVNGGAAQSFPAGAVRRITVNGLGGDDALDVAPAVQASLTSDRGGGLTYNAGSGADPFSFGDRVRSSHFI